MNNTNDHTQKKDGDEHKNAGGQKTGNHEHGDHSHNENPQKENEQSAQKGEKSGSHS